MSVSMSGAARGDAGRTTTAAAAYAERRRRDAAFAGVPGLFGEPAWDILLDLYVASAEAGAVPVTRACAAAAIAPTTALRCIANLVALELVAYAPGDGETALTLTVAGRKLMESALTPS